MMEHTMPESRLEMWVDTGACGFLLRGGRAQLMEFRDREMFLRWDSYT